MRKSYPALRALNYTSPATSIENMSRAFAALAAALIILAGCATDGDTNSPVSSPSPAAPRAAAPTAEGRGAVPEILEFQATTVAGERFDGSSYAGRPIAFWFWAPW